MIAITTEDVEGGKQSQVTISCLPNHLAEAAFVGEPCATKNEAMETACGVALEAIMGDPELKALHDANSAGDFVSGDFRYDGRQNKFKPAESWHTKKTRQEMPPGGSLQNQNREGGVLSPKGALQEAVQQIVRPTTGNLTKDMVQYVTSRVQGGFQVHATIPSLPNSMAQDAFAGEVCSTEKQAINSAASVALEAVMADPELKELHDRVREPKLGKDGQPLPTRKEWKQMKREQKAQEAQEITQAL